MESSDSFESDGDHSILAYNFGHPVAVVFGRSHVLKSLAETALRLSLTRRLRKHLSLAWYDLQRVTTEIKREIAFDSGCVNSHYKRCYKVHHSFRKTWERERREANLTNDECQDFCTEAVTCLDEFRRDCEVTFANLNRVISSIEGESASNKDIIRNAVESGLDGVATHCRNARESILVQADRAAQLETQLEKSAHGALEACLSGLEEET